MTIDQRIRNILVDIRSGIAGNEDTLRSMLEMVLDAVRCDALEEAATLADHVTAQKIRALKEERQHMNWKASEGLERATAVVGQLEEAVGCHYISAAIRWRMTDIVARALDQALSDGSEMDALNSLAGNGHAAGVPDDTPPRYVMPLPYKDVEAGERLDAKVDKAVAKKRGGRPKGSRNKKAKAGKPEAATEAEAS